MSEDLGLTIMLIAVLFLCASYTVAGKLAFEHMHRVGKKVNTTV